MKETFWYLFYKFIVIIQCGLFFLVGGVIVYFLAHSYIITGGWIIFWGIVMLLGTFALYNGLDEHYQDTIYNRTQKLFEDKDANEQNIDEFEDSYYDNNEQDINEQDDDFYLDSLDDIEERPIEIPDHQALSHLLLYGRAGQGKSAMAKLIAKEIGAYYKHDIELIKVTPAQLTSKKQLDEIMIRVADKPFCVLFIDEIHDLKRLIEQALYSALQDFEYDITLSDDVEIDDGSRIVFQRDKGVQTINLPPFTCIGATTLVGDLNKPLRDRFTIKAEMETYSKEELMNALDLTGLNDPNTFEEYVGQANVKDVVRTNLEALHDNRDLCINDGAKRVIADISFGTMRINRQYKKQSMVYAKSKHKDIIEEDDIRDVMKRHDIDGGGLTRAHRAIIETLIKRWRHTPEGKSHAISRAALGSIVNVAEDDIRDLYEPGLLNLGIVEKDRRQMNQLTPQAVDKYKNIY